MDKYIIILVAAIVLIALGGYLLRQYGAAQYDAGYAQAELDSANAATKAGNTAARKLEDIKKDVKKMSTSDIDNELRDLGIMRSNKDY